MVSYGDPVTGVAVDRWTKPVVPVYAYGNWTVDVNRLKTI